MFNDSPRKSKNGFALILKKFPKTDSWYVLLQYRSQTMTRMPGFIGCPGGRYEGEEDSLQAVVRETEEETGWIFKQESFTKINEGKNCDWYFVIKIDKPKNHTYTDIKTIGEIQDTNKLISKHRNWKCIRSMTPGHFWMPIESIDQLIQHRGIDGKTKIMGGLISRVKQSADLLSSK
jgi:8-oxo-dGTP pyrophosphatase MutT (NUDIX family)